MAEAPAKHIEYIVTAIFAQHTTHTHKTKGNTPTANSYTPHPLCHTHDQTHTATRVEREAISRRNPKGNRNHAPPTQSVARRTFHDLTINTSDVLLQQLQHLFVAADDFCFEGQRLALLCRLLGLNGGEFVAQRLQSISGP